MTPILTAYSIGLLTGVLLCLFINFYPEPPDDSDEPTDDDLLK